MYQYRALRETWRLFPAFDNQLFRNLINEHPCEVVLERSLVLLWSPY